MQGISWLAEKLLASQEGLCSMEEVSKYVCDVAYTIHGCSCLVLEASRKQRHCRAISDAYGLIMLVI